MALQREQMAMQQEQYRAQQAQYQEQLAISKAPPPPAPNAGAMAATPTLETVNPSTGETARIGVTRKSLRTDLMPVSTLGIPGAG